MAKMQLNEKRASIPTFLLYEDSGVEPAAEPDFVHIETIKARAGLHNWEIRPHRHAALHQFLILLAGSVEVDAEGRRDVLAAPGLLVVPVGLVHGFTFTPDAEGFVLTVADSFLERCVQGGPESLTYPMDVSALPLDDSAEDLALLRSAFEFLHHELPWTRPGRGRATAACLDLILVASARRLIEPREQPGSAPSRLLVAHFKTLANRHAAEGWTVRRYARELGVSAEHLSRACRSAAGRSPMRLVHDRLMAEAKRSLMYTAMSVQEVAFALGFDDPAYFTRFFVRRQGCSPSQFRRGYAGGGDASSSGCEIVLRKDDFIDAPGGSCQRRLVRA
ncbi:MAG: helix-turn-helix domain-containing protein [Caulobacteraceae bacterium]